MGWLSNKKKFFVVIIPIVLALTFFSLLTPRARRVTWYEAALTNLLSPVEFVTTSVSGFFGSIWAHYIALINVSKDNEKLLKENAALAGQLTQMEEIKLENERLKSILSYKKLTNYATLTARVIANDPRSEFKSVMINVGRDDGVDILMPVIGPRGIIGRVGKVSGNYSEVLLVIDPNSAVDVLVERSRARAILIGTARHTELKAGYYLSRLEYLERTSNINEGDVVVTSGFDKLYPAGIPVGTVHNVIGSNYGVFQEADVVPFENYAELEEVMVVLKKPGEN